MMWTFMGEPRDGKRGRRRRAGLFVCALALAAVPAWTAGQHETESRPIDGFGNNVQHPEWGTPGSQLLRSASGAHYADGLSSPAGPDRPSARVVSNAIFAQNGSLPNAKGLSDFVWAWGQFVDHDIGLTEAVGDSLPIPVPAGDPFFDPLATGVQTIPFRRSIFDPATGTTTPRQQINEITAYLDASTIYGSTPERAAWLRAGVGGRLKVTPTAVGDLLPFNDGTQPNAGSPEVPDYSTSLFVSGDIRVNEQPILTSLHTLFVREHNWQAARLARLHPGLSDDELYEHARRIVIGEVQAITYREFLPALLGPGALPDHDRYDPSVNPGIANIFSTAAYRLGHTLLSPTLLRLDDDGRPSASGPLSLRDAFFNAVPPLLLAEGIAPLLHGLTAQRAQEMDVHVIDDVRNFLFGPPGAGGLDLVSLNLQRGRDHGLPDYATVRADYGLSRPEHFSDITSDPVLAAALEAVYGDVGDVDAFAGMLAEDHMDDAMVGETLMAVLTDQFSRIRAGDRFWYTRVLRGPELRRVEHTRLSDVLRRNTSIRRLSRNVFVVARRP
jgi:peroxidase